MSIAQFETFADPQSKLTRDELYNLLKSGKKSLTFIKSDGSQVTHDATLNELMIPAIMRSDFANRAVNPNNLSFFSLTRREWRTVVVDRVVSVD